MAMVTQESYKSKASDSVNDRFTGKVMDSIRFVEDCEVLLGNGETVKGKAGELVELPHSFNLVVASFSQLIATFIKGNTSFVNNLWWEVGSGETTWADATPPNPTLADNKLKTPTFRKKIPMESVVYLNSTGAVTTDITNEIQITLDFGVNESNGYLREFGIFAGGTSTLSSGLMINRKTHGVIYKTTGFELIRKIHFKF